MVCEATNFLLRYLHLLTNHLRKFAVVVKHDLMDFPLCIGEDIVYLRLSRSNEAIHSNWIEFSLQSKAFRDYTLTIMLVTGLQMVLSPDEFLPPVTFLDRHLLSRSLRLDRLAHGST